MLVIVIKMKLKKKSKKLLKSFWVSIVIAVSFSWFIWKTWDIFNELMGGGYTAYIIIGIFILFLIIIGHFSIKKIVKRFANE